MAYRGDGRPHPRPAQIGKLSWRVRPATRAEITDLAKAAAWRLGDQISLAGLLYAQGNQDDKVEQLLTSIKPLAEAMEIEIKSFPPRATTETETYADVLHYLIKGNGAETGQQIAQKFGLPAGILLRGLDQVQSLVSALRAW